MKIWLFVILCVMLTGCSVFGLFEDNGPQVEVVNKTDYDSLMNEYNSTQAIVTKLNADIAELNNKLSKSNYNEITKLTNELQSTQNQLLDANIALETCIGGTDIKNTPAEHVNISGWTFDDILIVMGKEDSRYIDIPMKIVGYVYYNGSYKLVPNMMCFRGAECLDTSYDADPFYFIRSIVHWQSASENIMIESNFNNFRVDYSAGAGHLTKNLKEMQNDDKMKILEPEKYKAIQMISCSLQPACADINLTKCTVGSNTLYAWEVPEFWGHFSSRNDNAKTLTDFEKFYCLK